jgi:hypothetical protein
MATKRSIQGSTFLFTGTLTEFTREEAEAMVKDNGGSVLSGVTGKLNYLVVGENAGSKLAQAEALGTVNILTEKGFLAMTSAKAVVQEKSKGKLKSDNKKVVMGENILNSKNVKKALKASKIHEYDSIDIEAAEFLVGHGWSEEGELVAGYNVHVTLDGVKKLDVKTASALSKLKGDSNILGLNGLEELDVDVAKALANRAGPISLNGLHSISAEALRELSNCEYFISMEGLGELDDDASTELSKLYRKTGERIATKVIAILDELIKNNQARFKKEGDFKVRPGFGPDKFYLDKVDGSYDMSLQNMIHHILNEKDFYGQFLNGEEFMKTLDLVEDSPDDIYCANEDLSNYALIQYDILDVIYTNSIKFVGEKLISLGFDVKEDFVEYLE